jgi:DNA-binding NarL/FixJ family response regulator
MVDYMSTQSGVKSPEVKINKQGYANVNITNSVSLKYLKRKAIEFNLPVLERKWSKVDENFVGRQEQAIENRKNVISLNLKGLTNKQISDNLRLSKSTVSIILKKEFLRANKI